MGLGARRGKFAGRSLQAGGSQGGSWREVLGGRISVRNVLPRFPLGRLEHFWASHGLLYSQECLVGRSRFWHFLSLWAVASPGPEAWAALVLAGTLGSCDLGFLGLLGCLPGATWLFFLILCSEDPSASQRSWSHPPLRTPGPQNRPYKSEVPPDLCQRRPVRGVCHFGRPVCTTTHNWACV